MQIEIASDSSLLVRVGEGASIEMFSVVTTLFRQLRALRDPRIRNIHPAYASVLIDFDPLQISHAELSELIEGVANFGKELPDAFRVVKIPVCYGGEFGPDLPFVAECSGLSIEEVVRVHSSANYVVHFLGFSPGFGYLDGLPAQLECPRLESPRARVAVGSVGIAGRQTGVYPLESPGGWQLIGRTPVRMFDPAANPPTRLEPGDKVQFVEIARAAFDELECKERSR